MKTYTVGAMGDSYYEYLLKMWLLKQQKVLSHQKLMSCLACIISISSTCRHVVLQIEVLHALLLKTMTPPSPTNEEHRLI